MSKAAHLLCLPVRSILLAPYPLSFLAGMVLNGQSRVSPKAAGGIGWGTSKHLVCIYSVFQITQEFMSYL